MEKDYVGEGLENIAPHIEDDLRMDNFPVIDQDQIKHVTDDCQCEGKWCTKCTNLKCVGAFHGRSKAPDGLQTHCKKCRSEYAKEVNSNPTPEQKKRRNESSNRYHHAHRGQCLAGMRRRYQENIEYNRAYAREHTPIYQRNNPQKVEAKRRSHYRRNHVRIKAQSRRNYQANPQQYMATGRRWIERNRERYNAKRRPWYSLDRTRRAQSGGSFTVAEWEALKRTYNYTCLCCGKQEPEIQLTADHVIPVTKGGTSYIDNIQPLCKSCNSKKHTKIIDYRRSSWVS